MAENTCRAKSKTKSNYRGLFTPNMAPTHRAYCILFSLFFGLLEITTGAVFYHVISKHPESGGRPLHTPPYSLAVGLMIAGALTLVITICVAIKYGFDDGDESLEEDTKNFTKDDVLDAQYQCQQTSDAIPNV